ncbi:MAG: VCBS repeat-containing protein [Bryobacterales bacterium]|nr:VCBS repeat-containing protein [Bryobacterales bacterium]
MRLLPAVLLTAAIASAQIPVFIPPATYSTNGNAVTGPSMYWSAAADFNNDGRPDLAAADNRVFDNRNGFSVALAGAAGGYNAPTTISVGFLVANLRPADFNNDGRMDLLLTSPIATAVVYGNGNGTFSTPQFLTLPVTPLAGGNCTSGDLNKDGFQDVLVPGANGLAVILGNGNGTFRPAVLYPTAFQSPYVVTGDFNNDGNLDAIATVSSTTSANMFLGNGDGTFQPAASILPLAFGVQTGDFNNDGKLDLVHQTAQARQDGSNFGISIALGTGTGSFLGYSSYVFSAAFRGYVPGDFNQDGNLDIATFLSATGKVTVLGGRGDGSLGPVLFEAPLANGPFELLGADVDSNGSADLIVSSYPEFTVFRNPRGNPPLLAQLTLTPPSVIGGAETTTGTVTLGGPAPAPVAITLSSSNAAAFFPAGNTVAIPAGVSSMSFNVATSAVAVPSTANIIATAGGVTQTARLDIVAAFVLTGFNVNPASQYGIFNVTGTLTLNGPASSAAAISLTSGNPALAAVPATVTVPAGASSVSFPIALSPVAVNTPVNLSATLDGITQVTMITLLRPADTVTIAKAIYTAKAFQLKLDATSTSATSTLTVYNAATGALIGTLSNNGNGKYGGTFTVNLPGAAPFITVKSALGGIATGGPQLK